MKKIVTPLGNVEKTERGFAFINFTDRYGALCSLQQSSLADYEPPGTSAVWLGVENPEPKILAADAAKLGVKTEERTSWIPYPLPKEVLINTRMHLDLNQAKALVAVLGMWIASGEFAE